MQESKFIGTYKQNAMYKATILGTLKMVGFTLLIIAMHKSSGAMNGENSLLFMLLSFISTGISIAIPFMAGKFAIDYRKKFCDNNMNYLEAFKYLATMYICAALIFAVLQVIYFNTVDNGLYANSLTTFYETLGSMTKDAMATEEFKELSKQTASLQSNDIIFGTLLENLFQALYMPALIALFVRTKPQ